MDQRETILIVTNGESTERTYLKELKDEPWVNAGRVILAVEKGSPLDLVRGAARRRDQNDYDQAWAVCDVDAYPTSESSTQADTSNVNLVWSNPCFEVWLLLHFTEYTAFIENAKKAGKLLAAYVKSWDKTSLKFNDFRDRVDDAAERAKKLGDPPKANPSTDVWRLIQALK